MSNKAAQIAQRFGIMLMLATLLASLIVRVPVTLAERSTGRDPNPSPNALWTADQPAPAGIDLLAPSPDDSSLRAEVTKAYGILPHIRKRKLR